MFHAHLKIRKIGNSLGVVMPKAMLTVLDVTKGDKVYLVERNGAFYLTPYDPDFDKKVEAAKIAWCKEHGKLPPIRKRKRQD